MSRNQNAGRSHNIKIDNSSFERVEHFKYLGKTLTNQKFIPEDIKRRLKSENACCHLVRNLWSFSSLSKNMKMKIHRTLILPALYGCETRSFTLKEEHRLRVFVNGVLRRIFGSKRDVVTGEWRKLNSEELNDLYCSPNIFRLMIQSRRMRWAGHVARMGDRRSAHRFW
jgi:hypothetical protein